MKSETLSLKKVVAGPIWKSKSETKELYAKTSSGADLRISGKQTAWWPMPPVAAILKARELEVISCKAESSGADIAVKC